MSLAILGYIAVISGLVGLSLPGGAEAGSTSKGANPNGKPFVEIQGQILEVEGEVSTLQDQVDALIGQVSGLDDRLIACEDAIASLQTINADLQAQIDTNSQDIFSLATRIGELEAENDDLVAQIIELGDYDGVLQAQIDANVALITSIQMQLDGLSSLEAQIENNSALIEELQFQVSEINDFLALKQDIVDGVCPSGQAVQQILPDGAVVCIVAAGEPGTIETVVVRKNGYPVYCPAGYVLTGCSSRAFVKNDYAGTLTVSGTGCTAYGRQNFITDAVCARIVP